MARVTSIKAIREHCLQCTNGDIEWIRTCERGVTFAGVEPCPLWPFRFGKNPNISEATKAKRRAAAKKFGLGKVIVPENKGKFTRTEAKA